MIRLPRLFLGLFVSFYAFALMANESFIPKKEIRLPADDLIFNGRILRSEEALVLSRQGTIADLSLLEPKTNDIWSNEVEENYQDNELRSLSQDEVLELEGVIG